MIHFQRGPIPKDLDGATSSGGKERDAWEQFFAGQKDRKPKFSAYKKETVRDALRQIFHGKCSYCETRIFHITPEDIEHYRPKSAILASDGKTRLDFGYWWLAADWNNLLCACFACNRNNRQEIFGSPLVEVVGKGIAFPISDENARAKNPGEETNEKPLLLNPCTEEPENFPEKHLVCQLEGEGVGAVFPATNAAGELDPQGEATIRILSPSGGCTGFSGHR